MVTPRELLPRLRIPKRVQAWWSGKPQARVDAPAALPTARKPVPGHWVLTSHRGHPGRAVRCFDEVEAAQKFATAELSVPFPGSFAVQIRDGECVSRTDGADSARRLRTLHHQMLLQLREHLLGPVSEEGFRGLSDVRTLQDFAVLRDTIWLVSIRAFQEGSLCTLDIEQLRLFMLRKAQRIERSWRAEAQRLEGLGQRDWRALDVAETWSNQRRELAALDSLAALIDSATEDDLEVAPHSAEPAGASD